MTPVEFYVVFTLGIVGSLHCVGMCGPIVVSYSLALGPAARRRLLGAHLAYNAGRIVTYTVLGAVAGAAGGALGLVGQLAGIENVTVIVSGVLMVLAGLVMLDLVPSRHLGRFDPIGVVSRFLKPLGARIAAPTVGSKFSLGLLLGFLPCGLIYAALLRAVAAGTMVAGGLTMLAFGLGTTSALLGIGMGSSIFGLRLGRWGSRVAAVSVTLLGVILLWRGVAPMMGPMGGNAAQPSCH